ncbi:aldo/keto reductase [Vampirovibrio chlorellavorus]|uniref:aldo/keto reductase n=1 Tax=Vampirovibrio chlorellavorus TaxID=758823 RepID=UPI0026EAA6C0|nr:aldo/keto reductase [Vampirovibrio chlorellavorus]
MKLALGTVALTAQNGKHAASVPLESVREILNLAGQAGIGLLDAAAEQEDSLSVVGRCLPEKAPFKLVVRPYLHSAEPGVSSYADQLEQGLIDTLQALSQPRLYALKTGLSLAVMNRQGERLIHRLEALKKQQLIEKTAFSVSQPEALDWLLQHCQPDIVQLPLNVLDQRFLHNGHLSLLKNRQIEIHARDVFLQGVLLDPLHLHPWFWPLKKRMAQYHEFLVKEGLTPLEGALNFVTALPQIDYALIGVQSRDQLSEMVAAILPGVATDDFFPFASNDSRFVDPLQWNLYE